MWHFVITMLYRLCSWRVRSIWRSVENRYWVLVRRFLDIVYGGFVTHSFDVLNMFLLLNSSVKNANFTIEPLN